MSAYALGEPTARLYSVRWYRVPDTLIGGPYALVVRDKATNRTVSSVTGIRSEPSAKQRAWDYAGIFHTSDVQEMA